MGVAVKQEWIDQARATRPDAREVKRAAAKGETTIPGQYVSRTETSPGLPQRRG